MPRGGPSQSVLTLWSMHGEAQPTLAHTRSQYTLTLLLMAWGGPSQSTLTLWLMAWGGPLQSTLTLCFDAWGGPSQSVLTLLSMAWGGPSRPRAYCGRQ